MQSQFSTRGFPQRRKTRASFVGIRRVERGENSECSEQTERRFHSRIAWQTEWAYRKTESETLTRLALVVRCRR